MRLLPINNNIQLWRRLRAVQRGLQSMAGKLHRTSHLHEDAPQVTACKCAGSHTRSAQQSMHHSDLDWQAYAHGRRKQPQQIEAEDQLHLFVQRYAELRGVPDADGPTIAQDHAERREASLLLQQVVCRTFVEVRHATGAPSGGSMTVA